MTRILALQARRLDARGDAEGEVEWSATSVTCLPLSTLSVICGAEEQR